MSAMQSRARRMGLEAPLDSPDGSGGFDRTWQENGLHWVYLRPLAARAGTHGGIASAEMRFRAKVRASADGAASRPVAGQRFRDGQAVYLIGAVVASGDDPFWLQCDLTREVLK